MVQPDSGGADDATRTQSYYDTYWDTEGWNLALPVTLREVFDRFVESDARCLDVGCGHGQTTGVWLNEHGGSYVGVDVSESAVAMARERGLDARRISDATELPFEDDSFDFAASIEVMEHLFEPQRALAEIHRVVRPGGALVVTVPNVAHWRNRVDLTVFGRWNPRGDHLSPTEPWRDPHIRFFTTRTLTRLLESCGFDVVERGGIAEHALLAYVPGIRKLLRRQRTTSRSRRLAQRLPTLLADYTYVVGRVSASSS